MVDILTAFGAGTRRDCSLEYISYPILLNCFATQNQLPRAEIKQMFNMETIDCVMTCHFCVRRNVKCAQIFEEKHGKAPRA